jgi:hypothetical protein
MKCKMMLLAIEDLLPSAAGRLELRGCQSLKEALALGQNIGLTLTPVKEGRGEPVKFRARPTHHLRPPKKLPSPKFVRRDPKYKSRGSITVDNSSFIDTNQQPPWYAN